MSPTWLARNEPSAISVSGKRSHSSRITLTAGVPAQEKSKTARALPGSRLSARYRFSAAACRSRVSLSEGRAASPCSRPIVR